MSRPVPPIDGGIDGTTWDPWTLARHIDWFVTLEILEPARLARVMQAHTQKKYEHLARAYVAFKQDLAVPRR
ncbi:MAG: hypothetical protein ACRDZ4_07770 [Egibacteraceae bacterium]